MNGKEIQIQQYLFLRQSVTTTHLSTASTSKQNRFSIESVFRRVQDLRVTDSSSPCWEHTDYQDEARTRAMLLPRTNVPHKQKRSFHLLKPECSGPQEVEGWS